MDRIDDMLIGHRTRTGVRIILAAAVVGATGLVSGCLAVAAGAGAGVGYAVGHEQGEDHVEEGVHADDD